MFCLEDLNNNYNLHFLFYVIELDIYDEETKQLITGKFIILYYVDCDD